MYLFFFVFIFIEIIALMFLYSPVRILFRLDTEIMNMHVNISWTSFIRIEGRVVNHRFFFDVYLFKRKLISRQLKNKPKLNMIQALNLRQTKVKINYGLNEPYLTGIIFAASNFLGSIYQDAKVEFYPDFIPGNDFLRIEAESTMNAGKTLINLIKQKHLKRRKSYGTI